MAKVDGFNIAFTHRGSWKADLLAPGKEVEIVPVTWTKDWDRQKGTVFVWLKKPEDVDHYMGLSKGFRIAIAIRDASRSASSNDIIGIFAVEPLTRSDDPRGITCKLIKRLKPADIP